MDVLLEFITILLAFSVYGRDGRPRHPAIRNCVRAIAFGGTAVTLLNLLAIPGDIRIPWFATLVWLVCGLIVLMAEYELGSRKIAVAAFAATALLVVVAASRLF